MKISPSKIQTYRQCARKYSWEYVHGFKPPSTAKQQFGTDVHAHLERWLTEAEMPPETPAGRTAKQGLHLLPPPDKRLVIEEKFKYFWIDGIYVNGLADVLVPPDLADLNGRPLIIDHKTTSDLRWAKNEDDLRDDPQFLIYSILAMLTWDAPEVFARWIYYAASSPLRGPRQPKGIRAVTVAASASCEQFRKRVETLTADMLVIQEITNQKTPANNLPASPQSCGAYGGCPHQTRCALSKSDKLEGFMRKPTLQK